MLELNTRELPSDSTWNELPLANTSTTIVTLSPEKTYSVNSILVTFWGWRICPVHDVISTPLLELNVSVEQALDKLVVLLKSRVIMKDRGEQEQSMEDGWADTLGNPDGLDDGTPVLVGPTLGWLDGRPDTEGCALVEALGTAESCLLGEVEGSLLGIFVPTAGQKISDGSSILLNTMGPNISPSLIVKLLF